MIALYRTENSAAGAQLQEALKDLVVAHRVVVVPEAAPGPLDGTPLPAIVDGERVVSGPDALAAYLAELTALVERWRRFQVDACYIDDDGQAC